MKSNYKELFATGILVMAGLLLTREDLAHSIIELTNTVFQSDLDLYFRTQGFFAMGVMMIATGLMKLCMLPVSSFNHRLQEKASYTILLSAFIFLNVTTKENVPVFDEYTAIFKFLCSFDHATGWKEKASLLFEPYFECRIPVPYLIILIVHSVSPGIMPLNFMVLANAMALMFIAMIILKELRCHTEIQKYTPWFLFILFNTEYMQSSFNAVSGLCYNGVILFSLLSIRSMSVNTNRERVLSVLYACLAIFIFGNGFLLIPLLFLLSLRMNGIRKSMLTMIPLLFISLLYFHDYNPEHNGESSFHPLYFLLYIPVFLGSAIQFFYSPILPFIAGLSILILYLYVSITGYDQKNPVLYYFLGFFILTAILTASFRQTEIIESALKLRYGIFSSFALLLSLFILIDQSGRWRTNTKLKLFSVVAIFYSLLSAVFFYPESSLTIIHNKKMLEEWQQTGNTNYPSAYFPPQLEPILECSSEKGLWKNDF